MELCQTGCTGCGREALAGGAFSAPMGYDALDYEAQVLRDQAESMAGYALLGLATYFTCGPKESRAWTITRGTRAPQAAAVIHNDFERGFIACETIAYDDFVACRGEAGAKEAGKMRVEGRDYAVRDGDVLLFRFNV